MKGYNNRWGSLKQVGIPSSIFYKNVLALETDALTVLPILLMLHKMAYSRRRHIDDIAIVKVGQTRLMLRTGYTRPASITRAVKNLEKAGFILTCRDRRGSTKHGSVCSSYTLLNPETQEPLDIKAAIGSNNILRANGLKYFTMPICVLTTSDERWSLAGMSGSMVRVYMTLLWIATLKKKNQFHTTTLWLRKAARICATTLDKALNQLEDCGLIQVASLTETNKVTVHLCDPYSGDALCAPDRDEESNHANYFVTGVKGVSRRLITNTGALDKLRELVRSSVPKGCQVLEHGDGDLKINCPFHLESTPSCSVNPSKRCFGCFGCGKGGTLTDLLAELIGSRAEAIRRTAQALGQEAVFREPDSDATKYDYLDAKFKLKKQVLRYANDENGNKKFRQRRLGQGGWIWDVSELPPMLYHTELLEMAAIVCIVEGEKDADTITKLALTIGGNLIVGVTSGGAESWDASLAKLLKDSSGRIIVMPDADEPGQKYVNHVRASLDAEGIEYKMVSFDGTGAKDVTEYTSSHSTEDLVRLMGLPSATLSNGETVYGVPEPPMMTSTEGLPGDITL